MKSLVDWAGGEKRTTDVPGTYGLLGFGIKIRFESSLARSDLQRWTNFEHRRWTQQDRGRTWKQGAGAGARQTVPPQQ